MKGELHDACRRPTQFDPHVPHATHAWQGEQRCLSFYSVRTATQVDDDSRKALISNSKDDGFPGPLGISSMRRSCHQITKSHSKVPMTWVSVLNMMSPMKLRRTMTGPGGAGAS